MMQSVLRKLHFLFIIGVAVSMPFSVPHLKFNSYFIILLALNSILLYFFSKDKPRPMSVGLFLLFISVYFIHLVALSQTDNFPAAEFELQKKASILLFPIIFFFSPKLEEKEIRTVTLGFVVSCLLTALACLGVAAYQFVVQGESSFFFYHSFSGIAGMHAGYLSMYFCFSIAILLHVYSKEADHFNSEHRILYYACLSVLVVCIMLLGARMQMMSLILGTTMYFMYRFRKNNNLFKSVSAGVVIGGVVLGLVLLIPSNRERFKQAINYKGEYSINTKWGEQQFRPLIWSCASEVVNANPVTGVGTGDVEDELQKCYRDHEYGSLTYWKDIQLNAHNQFFETALGTGLPGLLLLVLSFIIAFYYAYANKKIIYGVFIILFAVSCLTESMLERQNGIVFYSFFNSLFAFHSIKQN